MTQANIAVIGVGFHSRRVYIPALMKLADEIPVHLVAGIDLLATKSSVDKYLSENSYNLHMLYVDPLKPNGSLTKTSISNLDALIKEFDIQGVVISTEPAVHKVYAEWALKNDLHILMDKPISTRKNLNTSISQARGIVADYQDLLKLYTRTQRRRSTIFSINVQRRYDHGFAKVKELVEEARVRFNIPITSIQATHSDGTWVLPNEMFLKRSHSYLDGYGKSSHSGYHLFDMVWELYRAGQVQGKEPDAMDIFSSPLTPAGFNIDLSEEDCYEYFGNEYTATGYSQEKYRNKVKNFGEVDSFNIVRLLKDKENICNISINLLHSSFSRRAWATSREDLYKGNGRVKHQSVVIQQGPFQSIQIHNYQSEDQHDVDNSTEFEVGGNNHFDIFVFRNSQMFGSKDTFLKISGNELEATANNQLVVEKAKQRVILEFVNFILGKVDKGDLRSNIDTHQIPVKIMSGIYQSHVRLRRGKNSLIHLSL